MSFHFRAEKDFSRIVELTPALRRDIEATVERLIAILDLFDGDENLEDDGAAEPWLGWADCEATGSRYVSRDDREEENDHGGDVVDEPHDGESDAEEDHRHCALV